MARRAKRSETSDATPRSGLSGKRKLPTEVGYAGNGRPALRWEVNPALIGIALAEIAEIAAGLHPVSETAKLRTGWLSAQKLGRVR